MQALLEVLSKKTGLKAFERLSRLNTLVSYLKNDIILTYPSSHPVEEAPPALPPSVVSFLASSGQVSPEEIAHCWEVVRDHVWSPEYERMDDDFAYNAFAEHGAQHGFRMCFVNATRIVCSLVLYVPASPRTLWPPMSYCTANDCNRTESGHKKLQRTEQRMAVLYTLGRGPVPVYACHLECTGRYQRLNKYVVKAIKSFQTAKRHTMWIIMNVVAHAPTMTRYRVPCKSPTTSSSRLRSSGDGSLT